MPPDPEDWINRMNPEAPIALAVLLGIIGAFALLAVKLLAALMGGA